MCRSDHDIACTLDYRDPRVLFMNEATSALDSATEAAVNEAIRALSASKTAVVMAQREGSMEACTQPIILRNQKAT